MSERLFFGFHVEAKWPEFPKGRAVEDKHITVAFLGNTDLSKLLAQLEDFPELPPAFSGTFDKALFLSNVAAWHCAIEEERVFAFQKRLVEWLQEKGYKIEERSWLPHVTHCRAPFSKREWEEGFKPLAFTCSELHLYESLGNLKYASRWSKKL